MLQGKEKDRKEQYVSPTSPIHLSTEGAASDETLTVLCCLLQSMEYIKDGENSVSLV